MMVEIFAIINKVLDLKIVQWALLGVVVFMLVGNVWFTLKYNKLRLDNALLQKDLAATASTLQLQNREIAKLGEDFMLKAETLKQANVRATKIAVDANANMKRVLELDFEGDCNAKVKQVYLNLSSTRNSK